LGGGLGAKTGLYATRQPLRFIERNQRNIEGDYAFTVDAGQTAGVKVSKTVRVGGTGSPHDSKQNWDSYEIEDSIRRLTPKECERLQGFPDDWTRYDEKGREVSDSQRYKMMGNAVTTNVVTAIGELVAVC
jgi:DNA (cytosine-5)-methyltransferase 1